MEPTVGTVLDESSPYVRYIATNNKEGAINHFNCITTKKISKDATSANQNFENVGSQSFKVLDQPDVFAALDVNIKQQPHLTQIRFVPASAFGTNSGGPSYYTFGDIISLKEKSGEVSYWVCARPCSANGGPKGMSHWFSFQLNDLGKANSNFVKYSKTDYLDYILPTDLGTQGKAEQHIQDLIKLLAKLNNTGSFEINNGLGELSQSEISTSMQNAISYYWKLNKYFEKVLPISAYEFNQWLTKNKEVNIFYKGYSYMLTTPHVWLATINVNGDAPYSVDDFSWTCEKIGWKRTKEAGVDFRNYAKQGKQEALLEAVTDLPDKGLVVRYKSGNQLIGKSGDDKDRTKSFTAFNKDITDIFVYKQQIKKDADNGIAVLGDFIINQDKSKSHEVCALNSADITENYSFFFKFWEPSSTEKYELQPLKYTAYAYMHLLNALILKSEEYKKYILSDDLNLEKLGYQMPKFSQDYETGITRLYNGLGVLLQAKYDISEIAKIVKFYARDKDGHKAASLSYLEYFELIFPYEKNGQYAEAKLKYDVKKQTYSVEEIVNPTGKDNSFFSLKSYKDKSLKLELNEGQNFFQLDEDISTRNNIKQATTNFLIGHKI